MYICIYICLICRCSEQNLLGLLSGSSKVVNQIDQVKNKKYLPLIPPKSAFPYFTSRAEAEGEDINIKQLIKSLSFF